MDTCWTPQIYLVIFTGSHLPSQLTDHDKVACDCSDNLHYSQLCHKCNLWRRNFKWTDLTCLTTPWTVSKKSHIMYDINQFVHIDTNLHLKKQFWHIVALTTDHSPHLQNDNVVVRCMHACPPWEHIADISKRKLGDVLLVGRALETVKLFFTKWAIILHLSIWQMW